ncbi:MAG: hypothetical protein WC307_02420 [Candidatus Nanoarchaeia archaeon]|jgi:hypothetical protein
MIDLREFYGVFSEQVVRAYDCAPDKYVTKSINDGLIVYDFVSFDSIDLKILAGTKRSMKELINPISCCNLFIKVPASLDGYISDLESIGFKVQAGKDLLLLRRLGDSNG